MTGIKVENCRECPFVVNDNEFGYCGCNLSETITDSLGTWDELPKKGVHDLCPLKELPRIVYLSDAEYTKSKLPQKK